MKFTALTIKQIKPTDKRYLIYEDGGRGFSIRVSTSGQLTYLLVQRFEKKLRYFTLGKSQDISLKDARKRAQAVRNQLEQGIDPLAAKQVAIAKQINDPTIALLISEYIDKWAKPRKRTWLKDEQILNREILAIWGRRKASSIKRREVILLLENIVKRGAPIGANRTLAVLRRMYNFAIERDILEFSPCIGVKAPSKENRKDRVLSLDEIRFLWLNLEKCKMSVELQLLLKLMLLTCQRKGELITAKWCDFDLSQSWWTIPASKAKNEKSHRVYLTSSTLDVLNQLKLLHPNSQWLFPSPYTNTHITRECVARAIKRSEVILGGSMQPWVAHDLRRTAASHMTALGISRLVVSKILNHADGSVTAIYDRHSYDREKRKALEAWSHKLRGIIYEPVNKIVFLNNFADNRKQ